MSENQPANATKSALKVRRSLLFVPGSRPERFDKAVAAGADMVCIDLEDAVAPADKQHARDTVLAFLNHQPALPCELGLRMNAVNTEEGQADLAALQARHVKTSFIMVPKVDAAADIAAVTAASGEEASVFPVIESARGLMNANEILASQNVHCALFGGVDFCADVGCAMDWDSLLVARSTLAIASAANDVTLFDVPYLDVKDDTGLIEETTHVRRLGVPARSAIHPAQIDGIHQALAPSAAEIEHAHAIIEAFNAAEGGAALYNGKLIELPVIKTAQRILAIAARQ
jgi:citrate lyase beta subunit